jgi:uncharacterized protein YdeI (YjbR/CyaY-like superfamily)
LKIAKKDQGVVSVTYCAGAGRGVVPGWIDGLKRACDEQYFLQRFTPRRPGSLWSKINVGKAEKLIADGRMRAGGLREIEAARADGRWQAAYHAASGMDVPEELAAALAKNARARRFFEQLDKTNRYAYCWRVHTLKKPESRVAKAAKFVEMLARGEKLHG